MSVDIVRLLTRENRGKAKTLTKIFVGRKDKPFVSRIFAKLKYHLHDSET